MLDAIHDAGGEIFAITSEPQSLADEALADWDFGFPAVGDPHHEILQACKDRDLVEVFYNEDIGHLRHRAWASHPNGYYQPAVLALNEQGRVLYRWRCVPSHKNMSGAGARPEARYTWNQIQQGLDSDKDALLDEHAQLATKDLSWFMFVMIFLAHGWFIRPRAFPLGRPSDKRSAKPGKMNRRIVIFLLLWVAAFVVLPLSWAFAALALWGIIVTPGIIEMNRQFQNITDATSSA